MQCCASSDGTVFYNFPVTLNVGINCAGNSKSLLKIMPKIKVEFFSGHDVYAVWL